MVDIRFAAHASESGHWYDKDANLVESVPSADGKRSLKPTLAHARKLQLAPGVTTIIRCADKPQLAVWLQQQAILAALTLPRLDSEPETSWLARVMQDMKETGKKAAEEGTRIHAAIQSHYEDLPVPADYEPHVEGVERHLLEVCGKQEWRSEVACVNMLGYGTKADLVGDSWLVDFKGKDGDQATLDALDTYDEHAMQLAATAAALGKDIAHAGIMFVSRTHPGACRMVGINNNELARGMDMFCALLGYWQKKNRYRPSWAQ